MMNYKAIVFDLDGTLLDTLSDIAHAANRVLKANGYPAHPLDAYRFFVGDGMRKLMERVLPEQERQTPVLEKCLAEFKEDYSQNWDKETVLYDGIADMLTGVADHGLKMAVLSNKPDAFTRDCAQEYLGQWPFALIMGEREGRARKPDPQGALAIAETLGVEPAECLYLGDTAVDMKTAVSAGMFPLGALWGFRDARELEENGAKVLLAAPTDLLSFLPSR